jgi:outer membrane protein, heavy metal efflux system
MLIGIYDLLRSRQSEINAARGYIDAIKNYWVARSALEKALAGPLPGAPAAKSSPAQPQDKHGGR